MALNEEQDKSITQMRVKLAELPNEEFIASVNVRGALSTVLTLIGMLPDAARQQMVLTLKADYPGDFT